MVSPNPTRLVEIYTLFYMNLSLKIKLMLKIILKMTKREDLALIMISTIRWIFLCHKKPFFKAISFKHKDLEKKEEGGC